MPALKPTDIVGEVIWLGRVADRDVTLRSAPLDAVALTYAGISGEAHGGLTRPSCSRVTSQHPKGTEIRNVRQLSIVSQEELDEIASACGLEALDPALVGASMVIKGIPDFTHLSPSSRLQMPDGATLVVDMENRPCHLPAKPINTDHPGAGARFKAAAKGRRGITAWVEREGQCRLGDPVQLHVPDQRAWRS
ncbi:MOSC domain-containing protein [Loktanella agnita]|uniref:MOSC domain-containing protein n=1 Tax=Loktanella agnita TaxID=287097 RepID=UPI003987B021